MQHTTTIEITTTIKIIISKVTYFRSGCNSRDIHGFGDKFLQKRMILKFNLWTKLLSITLYKWSWYNLITVRRIFYLHVPLFKLQTVEKLGIILTFFSYGYGNSYKLQSIKTGLWKLVWKANHTKSVFYAHLKKWKWLTSRLCWNVNLKHQNPIIAIGTPAWLWYLVCV